jgi:gluconate 2-dehydrogenase gamma chain
MRADADAPLPVYPPGTVRALLKTDLVTPPTHAAIQARLAPSGAATPRFFDAEPFATLRAACARLIPQPDRSSPVDLAGAIDARLADGKGDGWRYALLPPDGTAYRLGLCGLDECARARFGAPFRDLDATRQDEILTATQLGEAEGDSWCRVPARRFFEELLAEIAERYYSDPLTQEEIGYVGMADARGWQAIGLNQREAWEPGAADAS